MTLKQIEHKLSFPLPGKRAHERMAPHPKINEGEGIHPSPPILSSVMILFFPYREDWAIPFIKRTRDGSHHSGQIAFPGGKMDECDLNSRCTALRECYEEIGIQADDISIMGRLSDIYIPLSNFNITPFVGTIAKKPTFVVSPDEVEEVITIPINELFDPANKISRLLQRNGHKIVAPGYRIGKHFIWGATAMMIAELEVLINNEETAPEY